MPIELKASASLSCVSSLCEKVRTHARAHSVRPAGNYLREPQPRAPRNASGIGSEEQVFCEVLKTPSTRRSKELPSTPLGG